MSSINKALAAPSLAPAESYSLRTLTLGPVAGLFWVTLSVALFATLDVGVCCAFCVCVCVRVYVCVSVCELAKELAGRQVSWSMCVRWLARIGTD